MNKQESLDMHGRLAMRHAHFERMRNIHGRDTVVHGPDDIMEGVARAFTEALVAMQGEDTVRRRDTQKRMQGASKTIQ